jgi:hypothetical protein
MEDALVKDGRFSLPGTKALLKSGTEYKVVLIDATETPIESPKKDKSGITPAKRSGTSSKAQVDTGYQGIKTIHPNNELPKKRTKKNPLTVGLGRHAATGGSVPRRRGFVKQRKQESLRLLERKNRPGGRQSPTTGLFPTSKKPP